MSRSRFLALAMLLMPLLTGIFLSCEREPMLFLVDKEENVEFETGRIVLDIDVLWDYDTPYKWRENWWYSWDNKDDSLFGHWDLREPSGFDIRRYYKGKQEGGRRLKVFSDKVQGQMFMAKYMLGYYDILVWNDVVTLDGVQSLHFDEESSMDHVTAYTNKSTLHTSVPEYHTSRATLTGNTYYQPEFLFAGEYDNLHVSDRAEDYDSLIVETNTWYKYVPLMLSPVTYIYLTQVILHNNDKVSDVDGSCNLSGMARSVNLNTHITSEQDIAVNYPLRMKKHMVYVDSVMQRQEYVDVIGGRVMTFGLTQTNPYAISRAEADYQQMMQSKVPNYLEFDLHFINGYDSIFVFDVTDQVKEHYKGGVITIHLDVDKISLPVTKGGSMFNAVVEDYVEETHEFEM